MRDEIRARLLELSREEYESRGAGADEVKRLYGRPGRFIIERRRVSYISRGKPDEPISMRVHPIKIPFPEHSHDFIELMYVYSGEITHRIGEARLTLKRGDVLILGRGARHSIEAAGEGDVGVNLVMSVEIYEKLVASIRRSSGLDASMLEEAIINEGGYLYIEGGKGAPLEGTVEELAEVCLIEEADGHIVKLLSELLLSKLASSGGAGIGGAGKERRLNDYLYSSYASATLSEAAELLGVSPSYLSRWCKARLGGGFKELLTEVRFSAACELLLGTDMPIGSIISNVGYENSSYFHKEFKRRLGVAPGEYRKKAGKVESR
ncbi:MAG: helix-turn-helix domain-containing protein [Clostridia bacterium]|nr:helix-turn-helix domain-containing protein [Clostridia bacterium]